MEIREVKDYVQDIYSAMEAAEEFVNNWTFEEFTEDLKTQFVVIRAMEIIGEATKKVFHLKYAKNILLFHGKILQGCGIN